MATVEYSRSRPSPRYHALLAQYRQMHAEGEKHRQISAAKVYAGDNLLRHVEIIRQLIELNHARTILDYGSGKGRQYLDVAVKLADGRRHETIPDFWGVSVVCFDPGVPAFERLPETPCDGVICTDVLEHVPEEDVPWIVEELFSHARKFVFANVACYEAVKRLPNGENAHCTVRPRQWWIEQFAAVAARYPVVRYTLTAERLTTKPSGEVKAINERTDG